MRSTFLIAFFNMVAACGRLTSGAEPSVAHSNPPQEGSLFRRFVAKADVTALVFKGASSESRSDRRSKTISASSAFYGQVPAIGLQKGPLVQRSIRASNPVAFRGEEALSKIRDRDVFNAAEGLYRGTDFVR